MTTGYFPASLLQRLCRKAQMISCRGLNKHPEGWSKSLFDPMRLLAVFPALRLKPGHVLRAYQYRSGADGNGVIWAMPEDAPFPEPSGCAKVDDMFAQPPKPDGALDNYMEVLDGDHSPLSYLSASLFAREAAEFGAFWHGCSWGSHSILGADPWKRAPKDAAESDRWPSPDVTAWEWQTVKPAKWKPVVQIEGRNVIVAFHTFSALGRQQIYRHIDRFDAGNYKFESKTEEIALGPGGYIH